MKVSIAPHGDFGVVILLTTFLLAHNIKDRLTNRFRAACSLQARHRWCLTGTPIQNRAQDFGALLSFLRVDPFHNPSYFDSYIARPVEPNQDFGIARLQALFKSVALRRTKACLEGEIHLTPRENREQWITMNSSENAVYNAFRQASLHIVNECGETLSSFNTILKFILRLRQICNHGSGLLSAKVVQAVSSTQDLEAGFPVQEQDRCEACDKLIVRPRADSGSSVQTLCMHVVCSSCLGRRPNASGMLETICPLCANSLPTLSAESSIREPLPSSMVRDEDYQPSSKVLALIENLKAIRSEYPNESIKRLAFSSYFDIFLPSLLNQFKVSCLRNGLRC